MKWNERLIADKIETRYRMELTQSNACRVTRLRIAQCSEWGSIIIGQLRSRRTIVKNDISILTNLYGERCRLSAPQVRSDHAPSNKQPFITFRTNTNTWSARDNAIKYSPTGWFSMSTIIGYSMCPHSSAYDERSAYDCSE